MLQIKGCELAASAVRPAQYPPEPLAQIALFGRSNAGKSSLINVLLGRRNLARTSSAPGKTRLLNFYAARAASPAAAQELRWYFVDLPGYGYAKAARSERQSWLRLMDELLRSPGRRCCWQLVDARHCPSQQDLEMRQRLLDLGYAPLTIANKVDKLSRNARARGLQTIAAALGLPQQEIICFSAVSREGREQLLDRAEAFLLDAPPAPAPQTLPPPLP